jgi:hypothetical protein
MPEWEVSSQERKRFKEAEELRSILSPFYMGQIGPNGLKAKLKGYRDEGRAYILKEAQMKLIDTIYFENAPTELYRRRDGILAIESLKECQNASALKRHLNSIERLQTKYKKEKEKFQAKLRKETEQQENIIKDTIKRDVEKYPQLSGMSAIAMFPGKAKKLMAEQEKRYGDEFAKTIEKLRKELK